MTKISADSLLLDEGNKCFDFAKSYGFVHEQQLAIEDHWNEGPINQKLCHAAMNRGTPVEGYVKFQTRTMNTPLERKLNLTSK